MNLIKFFEQNKINSSIFALVIGVFIPLIIWLNPFSPDTTSINFSLINHVEKINLEEASETEKIKVFFNEQEIKNLSYTKYRIYNTGTLPIKPDDYIENLRIVLPEGVKVLGLKIEPSRVMKGVIQDPDEIVLNKNLVNPKEYFDVEITSSGIFNPNAVDLEGRIVGVTNYELTKENILPIEEERTMARGKIYDVGKLAIAYSILIVLLIFFFKLCEKLQKNIVFKKIFNVFEYAYILIVALIILYFLYFVVRLFWVAYIA